MKRLLPELKELQPVRLSSLYVRQGMTRGQRAADKVAKLVGSWSFILAQSGFLVVWVFINLALNRPWDPYPFILLNLLISLQSAYIGPLVMLSNNRQAAIDRAESQDDFVTNIRAESGVKLILQKLEAQEAEIAGLTRMLEEQKKQDLRYFGKD